MKILLSLCQGEIMRGFAHWIRPIAGKRNGRAKKKENYTNRVLQLILLIK